MQYYETMHLHPCYIIVDSLIQDLNSHKNMKHQLNEEEKKAGD